MKIIEKFKKLWDEHPLLMILFIAAIPRIFAAIFAKGYGMHDDHFGPIEQPYMILHDFNVWLSRGEPHGHSIFTLPFIIFFLDFLKLSE